MDEMSVLALNEINLNNYKNFYVVAKTLNFTKASEILCVSQPAISYSIKKLEEELKCKLFERNGREIVLTKDGEVLFHYVKISYHNLFYGMKKIQDDDDYNNYVIKIGVPTHIGTYLLSKIIEKFIKEYPGIKFKIVSKSTQEMVKMLEYHELDCIVDSYPIDVKNDDIEIVNLIEFSNCFVGNDKFISLANSKEIRIEEFNNYPLLLPASTTSTMILLNDVLKERNIILNPKIDVSTTEVMLDMVRRGMGIGYFTKMSVVDDIITKKLYEIPVNIKLPKALIQLAYIEDFLNKPAYRFIKLVKSETEKFKTKSSKSIRLIYNQKCPYNCYFCHHEGINEVRENKLKEEDIVFLFKSLNKGIGINDIHITGGEPLSSSRIDNFIKELHDNKAIISLTTNGYFIDKKLALFKYISKVNISIHSFAEDKYEKISGLKNSYQKVIKNIKELRNQYPVLKIGINTTIIKGFNDSIDDIKRIVSFSKSINASLKLISLFNDEDNRVDTNYLISLIEDLGYVFQNKTFRKIVYTKDNHDILLTMCTCDAVKQKRGDCNRNNDLYVTMDGLINLCRFSNENVSIYNEIINRNEGELLNKIDIACDELGGNCICKEK